MKKGILVFSLLLCSLLLFGCGSKNEEENKNVQNEKVLSCSINSEVGNIPFITKMDFHFVNDNISKIEVEYNYDLSSYTEEQRKTFANAKLCSSKDITETLGMNDCQEKLSGTNYIVHGTAEKTKSQIKGTLENNKTELEADSWICSIK